MRNRLASASTILVMSACGYPALPALDHRIGGRVRGLWDGADGVTLRLQAAGIDMLHTVSSNGTFHFEGQLAPGPAYTVTVATNPVQHTCVVEICRFLSIE